MKNSEYIEKVKTLVSEGFTAYQKKSEEYERLKSERDSGMYDIRHINSEITPKMSEVRRELQKIQETTSQKVQELSEAQKKELRHSDSLNPEDLTEDIKLLQSGLSLKERDIEAILERNSDNRTMTQLALRYAEEHGLEVSTMYRSASSESRLLDSISGAVKTAIRNYDNSSGYNKMRDMIFESAEVKKLSEI